MEQHVIGVVFANDEVRGTIVSRIFIHMVNNSAFEKGLTEGSLGDQDMREDIASVGASMVRIQGQDIAIRTDLGPSIPARMCLSPLVRMQ